MPHNSRISRTIMLVESGGLVLILLFLWLDEIFDLPHHLFGAPATPVNWIESLFETGLLTAIGIPILAFTARLSRRYDRISQEKDAFFGILSHDLKSPFTALLLTAEALHEQYPELAETDRRALAANLHEAARRTADLLENLLTWTRLHLEQTRPKAEQCDLPAMAAAVVSELTPLAAAKGVVFAQLLPEGIAVSAEPDGVRSILHNLLGNAVKFSHPGGRVELAAAVAGQEVEIIVRDQGVGMAPDTCRNLFGHDRVRAAVGTAGEKGTGLGLLLVRLMVERNRGRLWVRSSPGAGATFGVRLPRPRR